MSMSCCMCEPMETAESLGDDTQVSFVRANLTGKKLLLGHVDTGVTVAGRSKSSQ